MNELVVNIVKEKIILTLVKMLRKTMLWDFVRADLRKFYKSLMVN